MAASGVPFTVDGVEYRVSPWTIKQHAAYLVWLRAEWVRSIEACAESLPPDERATVVKDARDRACTLNLVLPRIDPKTGETIDPGTPELLAIDTSSAGVLKRIGLYLSRAHPDLDDYQVVLLANNYRWSVAFWGAVSLLNREGQDDPKAA